MMTTEPKKRRHGRARLSDTSPTVRLNFTIPQDTLAAYKAMCKRLGVEVSARVRGMVEGDLRKHGDKV